MACRIVRRQKNTVLTMTVSTVFLAYSGVGFALFLVDRGDAILMCAMISTMSGRT